MLANAYTDHSYIQPRLIYRETYRSIRTQLLILINYKNSCLDILLPLFVCLSVYMSYQRALGKSSYFSGWLTCLLSIESIQCKCSSLTVQVYRYIPSQASCT